MIWATVKFFLLILATAATKGGELENPEKFGKSENSRVTSVPPSVIQTGPNPHQKPFPKREENQTNFSVTEKPRLKQKNGTLESLESETSTRKISKLDLKLLFKEFKICRKSYSFMSNEMFKKKFYCFLLDELKGTGKGNSKADFRCGISKKMIDEMKGMQPLMKIFQRIFIVYSKNDSCESSREQEIRAPVGIENLKLKLGDEWISLEPKVSHLSHIYLGTSVYPILTEESWVIEKDYISKSLASTKGSHVKEIGLIKKQTELQSGKKNASKIIQFLTPLHWRKNESRFYRSLQVTAPKSVMSKYGSEEKLTTRDVSQSNSSSKIKAGFRNFTNATSDFRELSKSETLCSLNDKYKNRDPFLNALYFFYSSLLEIVKNVFKSGAFHPRQFI